MGYFVNKELAIYIIDNDINTINMYSEYIKRMHFKSKITNFTSYKEFEKAVEKDAPDFAIIDLDNSQGFLTANKIRKSNSSVAIIVASKNDNNALSAMQYHYDGYLQKPFNELMVLNVIDNILRRKR